MRTRQRLRDVDTVIETVRASGVECDSLRQCLMLPKENVMDPRDKYTVFSPRGVNYRKSVHKVRFCSGSPLTHRCPSGRAKRCGLTHAVSNDGILKLFTRIQIRFTANDSPLP